MKINVKFYETELKKLFCEVFSESNFFAELIFSEKLCNSYCFAKKEDNQIVSFLYGIEKIVRINDSFEKCIYIYGVGTKQEYRGKGLMRELMNETYDYFKDKNIKFLYLVPASKELFKMYEKLGYKTEFYLGRKTVKLENAENINVSEGDCYSDYINFSKKFDNIILMSDHDIKITLKYTKYTKIENSGFLWEGDGKTVHIRECFLKSEQDLNNFLRYLANYFETAVITRTGETPYAMIKPYSDFKFSGMRYTNMNFD